MATGFIGGRCIGKCTVAPAFSPSVLILVRSSGDQETAQQSLTLDARSPGHLCPKRVCSGVPPKFELGGTIYMRLAASARQLDLKRKPLLDSGSADFGEGQEGGACRGYASFRI